MKSSTVQKKLSSDRVSDKFELDAYTVTKNAICMANDPVVKKRTAEARAFLQKAGIPDIEKFRSK